MSVKLSDRADVSAGMHRAVSLWWSSSGQSDVSCVWGSVLTGQRCYIVNVFHIFNTVFTVGDGRLQCCCSRVPLGNVYSISRCARRMCVCCSVLVFVYIRVCINSTVICRRVIILNAVCVISSRDNRGSDVADTYETGFMHKHAGCRRRRARAAGGPGYMENGSVRVWTLVCFYLDLCCCLLFMTPPPHPRNQQAPPLHACACMMDGDNDFGW